MNSRRTEYKGYKRSDFKNDRKNFWGKTRVCRTKHRNSHTPAYKPVRCLNPKNKGKRENAVASSLNKTDCKKIPCKGKRLPALDIFSATLNMSENEGQIFP